jgi:hypothetical protein
MPDEYPPLVPDPTVPDYHRPAPTALVETARTFVRAGAWTFAKTMPWAPHHYVVRQRETAAGRAEGYDALRALILDYHYLRDWRGRSFRGVTLEGLTLWIMEDGLIVINAKPAEPEDFRASTPRLFDFL